MNYKDNQLNKMHFTATAATGAVNTPIVRATGKRSFAASSITGATITSDLVCATGEGSCAMGDVSGPYTARNGKVYNLHHSSIKEMGGKTWIDDVLQTDTKGCYSIMEFTLIAVFLFLLLLLCALPLMPFESECGVVNFDCIIYFMCIGGAIGLTCVIQDLRRYFKVAQTRFL